MQFTIKNNQNYNVFVQCGTCDPTINDTVTQGETKSYGDPGASYVAIAFQNPNGINALNIKKADGTYYLTFQGTEDQMNAFLKTLKTEGLGDYYPFGTDEASYEITGDLSIAN